MHSTTFRIIQKKISNIQISSVYSILLIGFLFLLNLQSMAQGSINITPKRIIFDGQKRIMEMNIVNDNQDSAKYSLSFVQIRMTEDGAFQVITSPDPGQNFADKYIRIFPRTVRLGPNDKQIVRLQLANSDQMKPGEYRSHLLFKSLVPQKALSAADIKKDSSVLLNIEVNFGVTVPIIIRIGESTTMVNITDIKVVNADNGSKRLQLNLNRTGNMSVYGEVSVIYIPQSGKEIQIGLLKGVAVYSPNSLLKVRVDLEIKPDIDLGKGKIRVIYSSKSEPRTEKLAEAELVL